MRFNFLFALLCAIVIFVSGCKNKKTVEGSTGEVVTVETMKINLSSNNKGILISGNIEGLKTVKLGFMVAGKLNFIAAEEGSLIQSGQLLASLDPENYKIAKDIADANFDQTQDEYNRLSQMHDRKSLSESDFSKVSNALRVAKAQQSLQAKNLSDTRLVSPISGVLLKKGTEVGEIIGVGLPLFVVSDIHSVKVNASIPEAELRNIKMGGSAKVFVSSLDSTFTGVVTEIGSVADAATRTFSVKIELKNPRLLIRPGMTAEIQMSSGSNSDIITIPTEAVLHDLDNSAYVYVVDVVKKQAFHRNVSLGKIIGGNIELTSGVSANELVVISGQHKLSNGSLISLK